MKWTNAEVDSTLIILGIHLLLAGIIIAEIMTEKDLSTYVTVIIVNYGTIIGFHFKSKKKENDE